MQKGNAIGKYTELVSLRTLPKTTGHYHISTVYISKIQILLKLAEEYARNQNIPRLRMSAERILSRKTGHRIRGRSRTRTGTTVETAEPAGAKSARVELCGLHLGDLK